MSVNLLRELDYVQTYIPITRVNLSPGIHKPTYQSLELIYLLVIIFNFSLVSHYPPCANPRMQLQRLIGSPTGASTMEAPKDGGFSKPR